jgi:hypothetical protein
LLALLSHLENGSDTVLRNVLLSPKFTEINTGNYILHLILLQRLDGDYRHMGCFVIEGRIILKNVVGLERGPLSLVSTTEELLDRKVAAPV